MSRGVPRTIWPLLAALSGVLVYLNSLGNAFALDDILLVRDNPDIRSIANLPRLFLDPYWNIAGEAAGLYRPVTIASLALNRAVAGAGPFGFHLVNVLLHALVCALAWFAARRAGLFYGTALLTALLFAVHPLHTEAVANVAGRAELLAAVWVLAAWLAHRRAIESTAGRFGNRRLWLAGCFYFLALLSKESAVFAPVLFWIDDRLRARELPRPEPAVQRRATVYAVYAAALGAVFVLRVLALNGIQGAGGATALDNPAAAAGAGERVATALWVLARYAWLFVWPAKLSSDYSLDAIPVVRTVSDPRWLVGAVLVAAVVALGVHGWRRSRPLCLGVAVAVLFLLPASNLPFPVGTVMAERLTYLPSFGICLLAGHLGARLSDSLGRRSRAGTWLLVTAVSVALFGMGWRSVARNPVWADNLTLSLHDVRVMPRSAKLHAGAGIALHADGRVVEAEPHYREAIEIYPEYAQVHYNLGELLAQRGESEEAIEHLARAASIAPGNPRPFKALAKQLRRLGRIEEALDAFSTGARLDPGDFRFRFDFGRALLASKRRPEAIDLFARLAEDDPRGLWGGVSAALVLDWQGRSGEAIVVLSELLKRNDVEQGDRSEIGRLLSSLERRQSREPIRAR